MKTLILLLVFFLSGCMSAPVIQEVKVPVVITCMKKADIPARPDYQTPALEENASDAAVLLALVSDWAYSRAYESTLESLVHACAGD